MRYTVCFLLFFIGCSEEVPIESKVHIHNGIDAGSNLQTDLSTVKNDLQVDLNIDIKKIDLQNLINSDFKSDLASSDAQEDRSELDRKTCSSNLNFNELKNLYLDKCHKISDCVYDCLYREANYQWQCSVCIGNKLLCNNLECECDDEFIECVSQT